jgi:XTP/dITP diphosphohydrolase
MSSSLMEIVLATRNRKKAAELQRILGDSAVALRTVDEFPGCPDVEEDQPTFEGNAVKKARAITVCTHMAALADDSGLEVFSLGGAPGVLSARYAGEGGGDAENIAKLLSEMRDVPGDARGARFVCCLAFALPDGRVEVFLGTVEGTITGEPRGDLGFGYDPVFVPKGYERTFAEMSPSEKDGLSHRNAALIRFRDYLRHCRTTDAGDIG